MGLQTPSEESASEQDFVTFYRRYRKSLVVMLVRRFGDRPDIEDVVQDAMKAALLHLPEHDPGRSCLLTWVRRITMNRMVDVVRREKHKPPSIDDPEFNEAETELAAGPEEIYERRQSLSLLRSALRALPERQRRVIEAVKLEGHTLRSAAEHLGLTMDKVIYALECGMKTLSAKILSQNSGPELV
jgi:RNA polymerase sigma-70 factor (ECF subfamily)